MNEKDCRRKSTGENAVQLARVSARGDSCRHNDSRHQILAGVQPQVLHSQSPKEATSSLRHVQYPSDNLASFPPVVLSSGYFCLSLPWPSLNIIIINTCHFTIVVASELVSLLPPHSTTVCSPRGLRGSRTLLFI
uniref:Uncharacterized protein n=1 Tax=Molossus molossus TaxID=27622 RepID=A0A7J8JW26_MOLMO|nr:hypothetical protein HJG59_007979 [Molossus molossus]